MIKARIDRAELSAGRQLTFTETKLLVEQSMSDYEIEANYVPYR